MLPNFQKPDFSKTPDEALAEFVKKGDDRAFGAIIDRYLDHIFNFARQYAKSDEDTEDIVQDSFFKAWKHISKFQKGKTFRPWLFTIVRNTALDHIKRRKAMVFSELDNVEEDMAFADTLSDSEPLPPEIFDQKILEADVNQALSILHPEHRAVLLMHYQQEMTFDEIANVMAKPMNTVKSWHRRALTKLRSHFLHHKNN